MHVMLQQVLLVMHLQDSNLNIRSLTNFKYCRNTLSEWWHWCRLHLARSRLMNQLETQRAKPLLKHILRRWCHFIYNCGLTKQMYLSWVAYSTKKVQRAQKGVLLTQHTEIRTLARAFNGLRHCMVSAEIASQYRLSLKNIQVDSCRGHAFRVWMRHMRQCAYQLSYVDARKQVRIRTLFKWAYREWRVKAGRIRKLKVVLRTIKMINNHNMRKFMYQWNKSIRQGRIMAQVEAKTIVREDHFLCYTVFRMWGTHVYTLLMEINVRIVAIEEDLLRYS